MKRLRFFLGLSVAAAGFQVSFLWDLTRPVSPESDAPTRAALDAAGIGIVEGSNE